MNKKKILITLSAVLISLVFAAAKPKIDICKPTAIEDNILVMKDGKRIKTHLYELQYVGCLAPKSAKPYLILSGRECTECDDKTSLYVQPLEEASSKDQLKPHSYPGKVTDKNNGDQLMYEARVFYGQCFKDAQEGMIWFQNSRMKSGKMEKGVYLIRIDAQGKMNSEKDVKKNAPELKNVLEKVKGGKCREIPGKDRYDFY